MPVQLPKNLHNIELRSINNVSRKSPFPLDDAGFSISKQVLPSLEGFAFDETVLGDPRGCIRQYRNSRGVHVREYANYFEIHVDVVDPRANPLGHLITDSPETLVAFGAASILSRKARHSSSIGNPLGFLFLFLSFNRVLRKIKRLFLS